MPIELNVWRIDEGAPRKLVSLASVGGQSTLLEEKLEDIIVLEPSILGLDVMLVGRQVPTSTGGIIDLLGMDRSGELSVIELKRGKTPRDVVAQVLDYGSWVRGLDLEAISGIFGRFAKGASLEVAFADRYKSELPEAVNVRHRLVVVASEMDPSTERIVNYLADEHGVNINVLFFRQFDDEGRTYLGRTWLIDSHQPAAKPASSRVQSPAWDGESFYVNFGESEHRSWEDGRRYGFLGAGHGAAYRAALQRLPDQARVFAYVPGRGYVGVGRVTGLVRHIADLFVDVDGVSVPFLQAPHKALKPDEDLGDPDLAEYAVPVRWEATVPVSKAIWKSGLFAIPTVVSRFRDSATMEFVLEALGLESVDGQR